MFKYLIKFAYCGTAYSGWQVQINATSIQSVMEKALTALLNYPTQLSSSGRTDRGVHALGQQAHFTTAHPLTLDQFISSYNALLPTDIRVINITQVPASFHARFSAVRKTYAYHIFLGEAQSPFERDYAYHFEHPFNLQLFKEATKYFIGTHDFTSFANKAYQGAASNNPVKTIYSITCHEKTDNLKIVFEGNGFLYKMVRNIVGTLIEVANQRMPLEQIPEIFAKKNRSYAGKTAPPHGLFLLNVTYPLGADTHGTTRLSHCTATPTPGQTATTTNYAGSTQ